MLVVGSGCAGVKAATEAGGMGADTLVVSPLATGKGGSSFYRLSSPWGINFAEEKGDDKQHFFDEIMGISRGSIDPKLAEVLVDQSHESFQELVNNGISFITASSIHLNACFADNPRGALLLDIEQAAEKLKQKATQTGVQFIETLEVVDLVIEEGVCHGAIALDQQSQWFFLNSRSTVLATGGAEGLWAHTFSNGDTMGSSYAMAARYGASLVNLEFVQFIPGTLHPVRGINFYHPLLSHQPKLYNSASQPFLGKYLPNGMTEEECLKLRAQHGPFNAESSSRAFDLAIVEECESGARLEFERGVSGEPNNRYWVSMMQRLGLDDWEKQLRIFPHCQAFNGGIAIDREAKTSIEGVYACGESAGGYHGANRLGGNSILATQVFGKIAGRSAASAAIKSIETMKAMGARKSRTIQLSDRQLQAILEASFQGSEGQCQPNEMLSTLQQIMQKAAFLKREENTLKSAIIEVRRLGEKCNPFACDSHSDPTTFLLAFRVKNALLAAELILSAMQNRRETLGGHYRTDYEQIPEESVMHRIHRKENH